MTKLLILFTIFLQTTTDSNINRKLDDLLLKLLFNFYQLVCEKNKIT
jgi:hypothetical protein